MGGGQICPAYAGVIPVGTAPLNSARDLSRVCGGDPIGYLRNYFDFEFVPRMRG